MKPHDQFAKNYLEQLLSPLGIVEISKEVSDETRHRSSVVGFHSVQPNHRQLIPRSDDF